MSITTISRVLIVFGIAVIAYAMMMDTSVSTGYGIERVHNIGLVSQQQNLMILGGLAFIGGIILVATNQKTQSSDDEKADKSEEFRKSVDEKVEAADQFFRSASDGFFSFLDRWLTSSRDKILSRIGMVLYTVPFFTATWPVILLVGLYALRPIPGSRVIMHMLYFHLAMGVVFAIGSLFMLSTDLGMTAIFAVVACIDYLIIRFMKQRQAATVVEATD